MDLKEIEEVCKRRGFFWRSDEIYGGISGLFTFGHLGTMIKNKFENKWRNYFLSLNDNFFEIDASDIMSEPVFKASGHLESFVDPVCKCAKCGNVERADHIVEDELNETFEGLSPDELMKMIKKHNIKCSNCGGEIKEVYEINMMFPLKIGVSDTPAIGYLRPETAQGAFVNFKRMFEVTRKKLPLGLAIVGKAYRNEINPRKLLMRKREFTQAELQIFFNPNNIKDHEDWNSVKDYKLLLSPLKDRKNVKEMKCSEVISKIGLPKMYVYYMAKIQQFYLEKLGIEKDVFRFKELSDEEKAFYNKYHWDIELNIKSAGGFSEVAGIHYRTDHDLSGHQKQANEKMTVSMDKEKFIPHVIELSFGVDRNVFALIDSAFVKERDQIVMKFANNMSPIDIAVFPLVKREGMDEKAREIYNQLKQNFNCVYDESGSIGRRYARQDEIGTRYCITVDSQTLEDDTVTVRDRDTTKQVRIKTSEIENNIKNKKE